MKKVLLTIALSIFILIPININADITCTYNPVNELGDNYGEINITRKTDGSFFINDIAFTGSSISLGTKINAASVYFAGSDAILSYNHVSDSVDNYCHTYDRSECPTSVNITGSFYKFDCKKSMGVGNIGSCKKGGNAGINGNLSVLNHMFTGNTCPTLNFALDYDKKDASKFYMILLSNDELTGINTHAKAKGTPKVASTEYNIDVVYYSAGTRINHNYFDSVVYNKDTGNLKFKMTDYYGGESWSIIPTAGQSHTVQTTNPVKFLDADYTWLKFQFYGDVKNKLDNWKINDYMFAVFSDGQAGTLNHYLIGSSAEMISMCENLWGYEYNDCKSLLDNAREKAKEDLDPNYALTKFDIDLIPLCAPTSGALKVFKIIGFALVVIKILVPIALIIYGSLDFFKVVVGKSQDDMSNAIRALIQRGIIALLVFLTPSLVYYFISILGNSISRDDSYFQNCNTCLLNPDNCPARDAYEVKK